MLIPWSEFLLIQEILADGEVTAEEAATLLVAEADRRAGNRDVFTAAPSKNLRGMPRDRHIIVTDRSY